MKLFNSKYLFKIKYDKKEKLYFLYRRGFFYGWNILEDSGFIWGNPFIKGLSSLELAEHILIEEYASLPEEITYEIE